MISPVLAFQSVTTSAIAVDVANTVKARTVPSKRLRFMIPSQRTTRAPLWPSSDAVTSPTIGLAASRRRPYSEAMKGHGQFCPVAVASEVFAHRWTPLILRELFAGSTHFNEIK